ncbi:MAG TPA: ATP-binding cassette domain-containing protein [Woeseiaceae bacterium]|jgi:iron complex transport system ATP-binding protein|nr:ATP-binding cassette domain-containing protein [Woeseiaceae bacterium]
MQPEAPLVEVRNATIWRESTRVFENLDLVIEQHERVAIVGPNGSGKTTLLKALNREIYPVVKPDAVFRILGHDRWNVWELRQHVGIVSQDLQQRYTQTTTALEVVVSGFHSSIGVHGILADRVTDEQVAAARAALEDLGVGELTGSALRNMSTGQQRRVILARALVHKPRTLILDEPTAGLDFAASFDYLDRIRRWSKSGHNIVIVTHHLNEIPPEVDRIVLLQDGRIAADGHKDEVLTEDRLSDVYGVRVRVSKVDGFYLAYPG